LERSIHAFASEKRGVVRGSQKALGHEAPVQALKKWKMKAPDLFVKNVRNHPGPDTYQARYSVTLQKLRCRIKAIPQKSTDYKNCSK
jgi:hypothetical protein